MRPLDDFSQDDRRRVDGVVFDLGLAYDAGGKVSADVLAALTGAKAAGLLTAAVTTAAAGTCDHLARTWPLDAVIGESGGFMFHLHPQSGRMVHLHVLSRDERRANWAQYEKTLARVMQEVPGAALAADQAYRETDLAIDVGQDLGQPLAADAVAAIAAIMAEAGMTTVRTATHVHGWLGPYDAAATARLAMKDLFAIDLDDAAGGARLLFAGTPGDGAMFDLFSNSVGCGEARAFETMDGGGPAYVTGGEPAVGLVVALQAVTAARSPGSASA